MAARIPVEITEKELAIDKNDLDEVVVNQPQLYMRAAARYANWLAKRDTAKDKLALVQARVASHHRRENAEAGIKMTETALTEQVMLDKEFQAATAKYTEARYEAELALALRESFQQRAFAIRDLVALYNFGYFSASSEKKEEEIVGRRQALTKRLKE